MRELSDVSPSKLRGVVGGGGFGACTLSSGARGRCCLGTLLVGMGALVAVVRGGNVTGAGVMDGMICTLGYVSGGDGCLGCV